MMDVLTVMILEIIVHVVMTSHTNLLRQYDVATYRFVQFLSCCACI